MLGSLSQAEQSTGDKPGIVLLLGKHPIAALCVSGCSKGAVVLTATFVAVQMAMSHHVTAGN